MVHCESTTLYLPLQATFFQIFSFLPVLLHRWVTFELLRVRFCTFLPSLRSAFYIEVKLLLMQCSCGCEGLWFSLGRVLVLSGRVLLRVMLHLYLKVYFKMVILKVLPNPKVLSRMNTPKTLKTHFSMTILKNIYGSSGFFRKDYSKNMFLNYFKMFILKLLSNLEIFLKWLFFNMFKTYFRMMGRYFYIWKYFLNPEELKTHKINSPLIRNHPKVSK